MNENLSPFLLAIYISYMEFYDRQSMHINRIYKQERMRSTMVAQNVTKFQPIKSKDILTKLRFEKKKHFNQVYYLYNQTKIISTKFFLYPIKNGYTLKAYRFFKPFWQV